VAALEGRSTIISRRRLPRSECELSSIALAIDPSPTSRTEADARTVASLRRGWERGVTTFDVSSARAPERAEMLIASAFPRPDPEIIVLVGPGDVRARPPSRTGGIGLPATEKPRTTLRDSLIESRRRMNLYRPPVLLWRPDSDDGTLDEPMRAALDALRVEGHVTEWGLEYASSSGFPPTAGGDASPALYSGPLSLLDRRLVAAMEEATARHPAGLIATDPFAGGLLDGSRISDSIADRAPGAGPARLRTLQEEFDPILRLAFLTEGRGRTLYEATLSYALHWPWVATVSVPLPPPERLDRLLAVEGTPPMTVEEMAKIARL
jgi:aryl-alcohol dehydrogenase-like predicted oxidoreductase